MRHCKKGRKFSRGGSRQKALFRTMAVSLILKERIRTTEAKAKALRPFVEKLLTKGRNYHKESADKLAVIKQLAVHLPKEARKKLTGELGLRYQKRAGGYTRIVKLAPRKSDGAKMAIIELVK